MKRYCVQVEVQSVRSYPTGSTREEEMPFYIFLMRQQLEVNGCESPKSLAAELNNKVRKGKLLEP